jgi:hypothetical protein
MIKKMKNMYKRLLIFILAGSLVWACTEEYQQAYSERVDANQSGIVGTWEGTVLQKEYAKALKDSLGNTVVDDKNRTVWYDTVEVIDAWTEAILFSSNGGLDSFAISTSMDSLEAGILKDIQNMPMKSGEWAVINTINPEGEKPDVSSVLFYNPNDPHNSKQSILWSIAEQGPDQLKLSYSFGSSTYDTLYIKTFAKR